MQIEDLEGSIEAMVFSTQYERLLPALAEDKAVLVRGLVLPEENAPPKISVQDIVPLEIARVSLPSLISIRIPMNGTSGAATEADRAAALRQLFEKKPGETEVRLRLEKMRDFSVILDVTAKVRPDKEFCAEVARICGTEAMEVLAG
jgi:DNA polymerase-3 subunit alpha